MGWVERSDTHLLEPSAGAMGIASALAADMSLNPSYEA
jgi:cysteine synthase